GIFKLSTILVYEIECMAATGLHRTLIHGRPDEGGPLLASRQGGGRPSEETRVPAPSARATTLRGRHRRRPAAPEPIECVRPHPSFFVGVCLNRRRVGGAAVPSARRLDRSHLRSIAA